MLFVWNSDILFVCDCRPLGRRDCREREDTASTILFTAAGGLIRSSSWRTRQATSLGVAILSPDQSCLQDLLAQAAAARGERSAELAAMDAFLRAAAAGAAELPPSLSALGGQILNAMGRAAYPYNPYITADYVSP